MGDIIRKLNCTEMDENSGEPIPIPLASGGIHVNITEGGVNETGDIAEANYFTPEETDGNGVQTKAVIPNEEFLMKVQTCGQPVLESDVYPMHSNPRGFCLIFNIFDFQLQDWKRHGSEVEAKRMAEVFTQLHFKVQVIDNPTKKVVETTVEDYSKKPELSSHDAFIMIVLTHGMSGSFITSDGLYIQFKDIIEKLNNKNCPNLINKPKLFFFSCCRGDIDDFGVEHNIQALEDLNINSVSDSGPFPVTDASKSSKVTVPMVSDIMICYSTVDGYRSYRCIETGTWLGRALCQVLLKHSHETDLLRMLTKISHSINDREGRGNGAKQVVEVILRGFKKTFYFNPGYFGDHSTPASSGQDLQ